MTPHLPPCPVHRAFRDEWKPTPPSRRSYLTRNLLLFLLCLLLPLASPAQSATVRAWGNDEMAPVLHAWQQAYRAQHPEISFTEDLHGTGTGMAGIITGTSELALMGRPADVNEIIGFEWVFRAKPLELRVLNGNLASAPGKSPSLVVLVAAANPLQSISLQQLAAILACSPGTAPTWSEAGAQGPWAARPVRAYLPDTQTGTGAFLLHAILGPPPLSPDCWNWSSTREFHDNPAALLQAFAHDPNGLAITSQPPASKAFKILAVDGVAPTPATVTDGTYPLARGLYIDLNRKHAASTADFLRFVLSPEGQAIAARDRTFLPLSPAQAEAERKKLD